MTFDLVHTIGNRKKRFLSCFYAGQLKTRKTIYGQIEFPFYGQNQKKMSVLLNAKSVFFMIRFVVEA